MNSGSVSIQDAIAKAKSIAADRGVSYDPRPQSGGFQQRYAEPQDVSALTPSFQGGDPRLAGRGYSRDRSRSPPRRDAYGSNPYRDERREDPRRGGGGGGGYNRGRSPSPDSSFRGARDPPMGHRANDGETETIRVKSSLVGLIIGRNGENLRKVESESGARVQFIQAKDSHVPERQCTISGSLRAREAAKSAIFGIIDENGGQNVMQEKGAYTPGMQGRAKPNLPALREGENSTQLYVPDKTVGLIIGRGGEQIKQLQEESGCHVNIVGENKSVNGLRPVNLIGNERATAIAKALILEIVESDTRSQGNQQQAGRERGGYGNDYDGRGGMQQGGGGGRDWIEKTIQVPSEAVGMIIGKGGETIKDLQKTSGCKINVNSPKPPDQFRNIDLAGSSQSMAEAERVIWEKVRTVQERDAAGGGRGNQGRGGGGGGRNNSGGDYGYSQQPSTAPAVPGYGQYMSPAQQPQAPPSIPGFQMPAPTQSTPQPDPNDPYAAWGGQAAVYAQWYQQQMTNLQQQPGNGGASGPQ